MQEFEPYPHGLRRVGKVVYMAANCLLHDSELLGVLRLQAAVGSDDAVNDDVHIFHLLSFERSYYCVSTILQCASLVWRGEGGIIGALQDSFHFDGVWDCAQIQHLSTDRR